jgi:hypothetical protein
LAAGLSTAFILSPHVPRDRRIDLHIGEPIAVTSVDVTWFRSSDADRDDERNQEPLRGASFRFSPGTAPQNINYIVQLPDGSYRVDLVVQRGDASESIHRTVTLDDVDRITLPLH